MDFEFCNEQFWCFKMDFTHSSGLFWNEDKFEIKNCKFEMEVGINNESFWNGAHSKWVDCIKAIVSKFEMVNFSISKIFCFRNEIFELQKVTSKFSLFRTDFFFISKWDV